MRRSALLFALVPFFALDAAHAAPSRAEARVDWFVRQRAYPAAEIPAGARLRAHEQYRRIPRKTPAPPDGIAWQPIGPAPIDTTKGAYETPNMSPAAGRASAVAVDPTNSNIIYAGYGLGGVWKTIDGGKTWTPLTDFQPTLAIGSLAIDPASPKTLYVGTGEPAPYLGYSGVGILKSTDAGLTFQKLGGTTFDGLAIAKIVVDGGHLYAAAFFGSRGRGQLCNFDVDKDGQGLYRSTDGGATWTLLKAGQVFDVEVDTSVTPRRLLISDYATGAFLSEDDGATWAAPAGLPTAQSSPKASRIELSLSPSNPKVVYAGFSLGSTAVVYVSQDGGKSFSAMPGAPDYCGAQCYYDNSVAVDPSDEKTLYVGGSLCGVWKTENATDPNPTWVNVSALNQDCMNGDAWYLGYVHPDIHAIAFDPQKPSTVYAAGDGGLARTSDKGATWSRVNDGVGTVQMYSLCGDPKDPLVMYGGAQDNGAFKRTGTTLTWLGIVAGDGGPCAVDPSDGTHVLLSNDSASILRTTNGFKSTPAFVFTADETQCTPGAPGCGDRVSFIAPLVSDPSTPGTFYVGTHRVYKTTNGGSPTSWTAISDDLTAGPGSVKCPDASNFPSLDDALTVITVAPSSPATIYTGSQAGRVFGTTDGGTTWTRLDKAPLPGRWVSGIAVDPKNAQIVYAAFSGFDEATPQTPGHVFRSDDGGKSWKKLDIGANTPVDTILAHPVGTDLVYAGTDDGVLVTTDGGKTWIAFDEGLPNAPVYALLYHRPAGTLVAGTFGRSAWSYPLPKGTLKAAPAELTFNHQQGNEALPPQAISVSNSDAFGSIVSFTAASMGDWLTIDVTGGDLAGAVPLKVTATANPGMKAPGKYEGSITLTPADGSAAITIPVHLNITKVPEEKSGCGCRVGGDRLEWGAPAAMVVGVALWAARRRKRAPMA
jgi:MYXO-CTERM domain-containing protein